METNQEFSYKILFQNLIFFIFIIFSFVVGAIYVVKGNLWGLRLWIPRDYLILIGMIGFFYHHIRFPQFYCIGEGRKWYWHRWRWPKLRYVTFFVVTQFYILFTVQLFYDILASWIGNLLFSISLLVFTYYYYEFRGRANYVVKGEGYGSGYIRMIALIWCGIFFIRFLFLITGI